ncbi:hypothetical protein HC752_05340 [Vibrio sp. S9_S30]|nr:hypothetical protein [Vibrio sp. S9_S30]MBD1556356.1 hypothetical protein [Vibrio sp. S9_S30]
MKWKKTAAKSLFPKPLMLTKVDSLLFSLIQKETEWGYIPQINSEKANA